MRVDDAFLADGHATKQVIPFICGGVIWLNLSNSNVGVTILCLVCVQDDVAGKSSAGLLQAHMHVLQFATGVQKHCACNKPAPQLCC